MPDDLDHADISAAIGRMTGLTYRAWHAANAKAQGRLQIQPWPSDNPAWAQFVDFMLAGADFLPAEILLGLRNFYGGLYHALDVLKGYDWEPAMPVSIADVTTEIDRLEKLIV